MSLLVPSGYGRSCAIPLWKGPDRLGLTQINRRVVSVRRVGGVGLCITQGRVPSGQYNQTHVTMFPYGL